MEIAARGVRSSWEASDESLIFCSEARRAFKDCLTWVSMALRESESEPTRSWGGCKDALVIRSPHWRRWNEGRSAALMTRPTSPLMEGLMMVPATVKYEAVVRRVCCISERGSAIVMYPENSRVLLVHGGRRGISCFSFSLGRGDGDREGAEGGDAEFVSTSSGSWGFAPPEALRCPRRKQRSPPRYHGCGCSRRGCRPVVY